MTVFRGGVSAEQLTRLIPVAATDPRLGFKARGLLLTIASLLADDEVTSVPIRVLVASGADFRTAVNTGLRQLVTAGYLTRTGTDGVPNRIHHTLVSLWPQREPTPAPTSTDADDDSGTATMAGA